MRITIVAADNVVLVEGEPWPVDCAELLRKGVQAIQVYDGPKRDDGWAVIEYVQAPGEAFRSSVRVFEGHPNHVEWWDAIKDCVRKWQEAEAEQRAKELRDGGALPGV